MHRPTNPHYTSHGVQFPPPLPPPYVSPASDGPPIHADSRRLKLSNLFSFLNLAPPLPRSDQIGVGSSVATGDGFGNSFIDRNQSDYGHRNLINNVFEVESRDRGNIAPPSPISAPISVGSSVATGEGFANSFFVPNQSDYLNTYTDTYTDTDTDTDHTFRRNCCYGHRNLMNNVFEVENRDRGNIAPPSSRSDQVATGSSVATGECFANSFFDYNQSEYLNTYTDTYTDTDTDTDHTFRRNCCYGNRNLMNNVFEVESRDRGKIAPPSSRSDQVATSSSVATGECFANSFIDRNQSDYLDTYTDTYTDHTFRRNCCYGHWNLMNNVFEGESRDRGSIAPPSSRSDQIATGEGFANCFFDRNQSDYLNTYTDEYTDTDTDHTLRRNCCYGHRNLINNVFEVANRDRDRGNVNVEMMRWWPLKELRGRIYTMAKDQNGCRILQAMCERSTMEEVEFVLSEVTEFVADLMKDQFGNYLVQKLVSICNDDQKTRLIRSLTRGSSEVVLVCMNPHGTRAIQNLLENLNVNQVKLVVKALYRGAATLAVDPNGHHVIQYCVVNFPSDINKPILTEIAKECYKIATDRSGCCVLQSCVEHSRGELRNRIISEIMANSVHLAQDPFGNYVLQHMVGLNIHELTALLVMQLKGNFASLSCNKYASNVVEKCLNDSGEEISTRIILELVRSPNPSLLLVDPYANFVIQSALRVSKGFAHECLRVLISKNMSCMRTNLYGKKILERLEKKRVNFA